MTKTEQLIAYATDCYEAGGHWIVECWDAADYNDLLEEVGGDVELAKAALKQQWELTNEQEQNCAWDGPTDTMDGDFDSAMASAGLGMDEDYGYAEDTY